MMLKLGKGCVTEGRRKREELPDYKELLLGILRRCVSRMLRLRWVAIHLSHHAILAKDQQTYEENIDDFDKRRIEWRKRQLDFSTR